MNQSKAIHRRPVVRKRTGLSDATIDRLIKADLFPKPIQLGARSVGWLESEIDAWIDSRIAASRAAA